MVQQSYIIWRQQFFDKMHRDWVKMQHRPEYIDKSKFLEMRVYVKGKLTTYDLASSEIIIGLPDVRTQEDMKELCFSYGSKVDSTFKAIQKKNREVSQRYKEFHEGEVRVFIILCAGYIKFLRKYALYTPYLPYTNEEKVNERISKLHDSLVKLWRGSSTSVYWTKTRWQPRFLRVRDASKEIVFAASYEACMAKLNNLIDVFNASSNVFSGYGFDVEERGFYNYCPYLPREN